MGKRSAYQLISSAKVIENVRNCAQIEPPSNESQARPLTQLLPEQQVEAWQAANDTAKAEDRSVTANLQQTVGFPRFPPVAVSDIGFPGFMVLLC